ncbi:MAG: DUF1844 domain-containing protein [Desulfobulbaceae bacterium]|nr:DUF1844 domain-containing protein [Desulfobulbaceae bacterium]
MSDKKEEAGDKTAQEKQEKQENKNNAHVMPEVTFAAFIMSLSTSALYHLGEIADPSSGKTHQDLVLAKHTIDTLSLLHEKTKGNLNDEEKGLLENIMYDLRMRYVNLER